jgi:hypothetical protein
MYLRYIASYEDHTGGKIGTGIFRAADFVRDHTAIDAETKTCLQALITWFDENLPVPDFYDDPATRAEENHTYFWFKTSAQNFIERMEELCAILEANGVTVKRLRTETPPGDPVFDDHCQIAVLSPDAASHIK